MTEQEAKTKWCPFARAAGAKKEGTEIKMADAPAFNRLAMYGDSERPSLHPTVLCIGSHCMAWRWAAFTEFSVREAASKAIAESMVADLATFENSAPMVVGGYCGLAGKP